MITGGSKTFLLSGYPQVQGGPENSHRYKFAYSTKPP